MFFLNKRSPRGVCPLCGVKISACKCWELIPYDFKDVHLDIRGASPVPSSKKDVSNSLLKDLKQVLLLGVIWVKRNLKL